MALSFENFQAFLRDAQIRYLLAPDQPMAAIGVTTASGRHILVHCFIESEGTLLQLRTNGYLMCPPNSEHRPAVVNLLNELNHRLRLVKFTLDPFDGEITIFADLALLDSEPTAGQILGLIGFFMERLREYFRPHRGDHPHRDRSGRGRALRGGSHRRRHPLTAVFSTKRWILTFEGREDVGMLQYKAGYKFVEGGVHAQVLDFPAAITCGGDLAEARQLLAVALIDVAETLLELGQPLPIPNPQHSDVEMDIEEPIYLHLQASTAVEEAPVGVVAP